MPSVLAYWDIRGLAQPIRLLLNYVGEEFEDRQYSCGPAPDYNKDCWFGIKFTLGFDFPNLPYYMDEDVKVTSTNAILRHIGRKYNLCGKTPKEQVCVDMMLEESMDLRNNLIRLVYAGSQENFEKQKPIYMEYAAKKLKAFDTFLGGQPFFAGEEVTIGDFHIYEMFDQSVTMEQTFLKDFPRLQAFKDRFEALPAIKKYMTSDKFMKRPFNNKMAAYGST